MISGTVIPDSLSAYVGISYIPVTLGSGRIKQSAEDFQVQEISPTGVVAEMTGKFSAPPQAEVYKATLCKTNLSTTEARHLLASSLKCSPGAIGVTGMKDVKAVTAQFVSLHGVILPPELKVEGLSLHSITPTTEILRTGMLQGNRFTIRVLTPTSLDDKKVTMRVEELTENGFPNFYGPQRFGPRGNNHHIGEQLLRGNYDEAAKLLVTESTPFEPAETAALRFQAAEKWGDWSGLLELFSAFPHELRSEVYLLTCLHEGKTTLQFWNKLTPQSRFFAYSYGSFLFNQALSKLLKAGGPLPETIPTIAASAESTAFYKTVLGIDTTAFDHEQLKLPAIATRVWHIQTSIKPAVHSVSMTPHSVELCFDLPKGSYATTFLSQLFNLQG